MRVSGETCGQMPVEAPELGRGAVGERQVGLVEGLHGPDVLPVAVVQVGLDVHAHVLRAGNHLAAKVIRLRAAEGSPFSALQHAPA